MPKPLTTHELARKLLEGPDEPVVIPMGLDGYGDDSENYDNVRNIIRADVWMSAEGYWRPAEEPGRYTTVTILEI